jgi:hypothetical protein
MVEPVKITASITIKPAETLSNSVEKNKPYLAGFRQTFE